MGIPGSQQLFPMLSYIGNDIANFMRGKPQVRRDGEIMKPYLGFFASRPDVNVRGLASFI
jgi:hypothetical protein